ncbi:hypothetical protein COLO4_37507 [Corchorus olitorius]|uniref:FAR1 domain-containing protein n=1 Tax=Corchorus olitorius TaxID=93759 RepID=A0A1R3G132_9ROSI|nr:hypothetical protein COLO4_37507 [Corchorus olitorius]
MVKRGNQMEVPILVPVDCCCPAFFLECFPSTEAQDIELEIGDFLKLLYLRLKSSSHGELKDVSPGETETQEAYSGRHNYHLTGHLMEERRINRLSMLSSVVPKNNKLTHPVRGITGSKTEAAAGIFMSDSAWRVLLLRGEEVAVDKFCGGTLEAGLLEMDLGLSMFDLNDPYVVDVDSEDEDVEVSDHRSGRRPRLSRAEKEAERVPHQYFLKVDTRNLQPSDVVGKIEFADLVEATRFYRTYSVGMGFGFRKSSSHRHPETKQLLGKKYVCSLEGVREEQYYSSENQKRSPKLESRINCGAHMRILRNGSK